MNYAASNTELWNLVIQIGILASLLLAANFLRRRVPFIKKSLMPTAVIAGFILLIIRNLGWYPYDTTVLESLTYHGIAIGFISLALRTTQKNKDDDDRLIPPKSGALIVSTYVVQGIIGLTISLLLHYTFMPELFEAGGILLPMGYGQGPGQANNIGSTFEALGFTGGRSFALAIAAAGYLCACVVGVVYINILARKRLRNPVEHGEISGSVVTISDFEDENEIPVAKSIDRFSIQFALVLLVYLVTFLLSYGIDTLITAWLPGVSATVSPLLWGFNFILGSLLAMLLRKMLSLFRKTKVMTRQYQNNYLLSRISGLAFDIMIICGIASIDISDLSGLWVPFLIMAVLGGVATFLYLKWITAKLYPSYPYEAFVSMFGMLTGTISSGVMLLRELDPDFRTPAANNLLTGSTFAIVFGVPMLALIGIAPQSSAAAWTTFGLLFAYLALLLLFILRVRGRAKKEK